jgi:CheY-like chemotaxis protein
LYVVRFLGGMTVADYASMGRILVVDGDRSTVTAMTTLLREDGHEVEPFTSGSEAIAALRSGRAFDAVVTDFEIDGAAVTRAARESSPNACIVITHQGQAGQSDLRYAGACVVVDKPIVYDALHGALTGCRAHGGHAGPRCARRFSGVAEKLTQLHGQR